MPKIKMRLRPGPLLEELTETPSWIWGRRFAAGRGMGGQVWERKGRKRGRGRQGKGEEGPLRLPIPGSLFYPSPPLILAKDVHKRQML